MDFLEFEVGTDVVGDVIETAEVGSNTSLNCEVFIKAIAGANSHSLFRVVTADGNRHVELADIIRLEETVKSSLRSKALLHLFIEAIDAGIDGLELTFRISLVLFNKSTVLSNIVSVRLDVALVRGDVGRVRGDVALVRGDVGRVRVDLVLKVGISGLQGTAKYYLPRSKASWNRLRMSSTKTQLASMSE